MPPLLPDKALSRGAFIASIVDHFEWVHSSQYVDSYKALQPTFADVTLGVTPFARQIEIALEEGLVSNAEGFFHPDRPMTARGGRGHLHPRLWCRAGHSRRTGRPAPPRAQPRPCCTGWRTRRSRRRR